MPGSSFVWLNRAVTLAGHGLVALVAARERLEDHCAEGFRLTQHRRVVRIKGRRMGADLAGQGLEVGPNRTVLKARDIGHRDRFPDRRRGPVCLGFRRRGAIHKRWSKAVQRPLSKGRLAGVIEGMPCVLSGHEGPAIVLGKKLFDELGEDAIPRVGHPAAGDGTGQKHRRGEATRIEGRHRSATQAVSDRVDPAAIVNKFIDDRLQRHSVWLETSAIQINADASDPPLLEP
jgi:hypothetical protein